MQLHSGRPSGRRDDAAPASGPDGRLEYTLFGAPTLGWDEVLEQSRRVEEAERIRTLYVALTRAERRLVVAGLWPELQQRGSVERSRAAGQLIGAVACARAPRLDLGACMTELAAAGRARLDADGARWVFPGLLDAGAGNSPPRRSDAGLPSSEECARQAGELAAARAEAARREARDFGATASALAHLESEPEPHALAERRFGEARARRRAGRADALARAVGTAIHRVLEELDLSAEPAAELARARAALADLVAGEAEEALREDALAQSRELLDALARGPLFARLRGLADAIVCRELPLLLPPLPEAGPVGFVAGVADLVYRDPADGRLVVVDYKSDRLDDLEAPEALARRRAYRRQGDIYQRALREALSLDYEPRLELWFLRAGRVL
jgi:ATP-dependent exoDNAse (exonuclease V) beta subunit